MRAPLPHLLTFTVLLGGLSCSHREDADPMDWYTDVTAASGLDFVHFNGMSGELYFSEIVGAGAALFDADGDGDLDAYLVQGAMLGPGKTIADALLPPHDPGALHDRLFRNLWAESGELAFEDVTAGSGLEGATGYGMGVAVGDVNNDGHADLYLTNAGPNQLWISTGDRTFRRSEENPEVADPRWSTSAAFLDFDRDGWLDLYVANYVRYRPENHKGCLDSAGAPEYCGPHSFPPETDRLFRNTGNGRFEDVTESSGIGAEAGSGLGVVTGDFDGDGWVDIYVGNDLMRNLLWINQGDGTFRNEGLMSGTAVGALGKAEATMGVDAGDLDNDGDLDLFMTHLDGETNTLYLNAGDGLFLDHTARLGLAEASRPATGFGTGMIDVDNDGWLDIVAVNGAVKGLPSQKRAGEVLPLRQSNQLFVNGGASSFSDQSLRIPAFAQADVSRGLAAGDLDNDGDLDLLLTHNAAPAQLLRNDIGHNRPWIGFDLVGGARRVPQGTELRLRQGSIELLRRGGTDSSYCSARDPRVVLGLASLDLPASAQLEVEVRWENGRRETFRDLQTGRYHPLKEGTGAAVEADR